MYHPQLDVFICVADCGSFSKAAEKLFISSTAVMKQMNQMEAGLELKLFERTNHGIVLTPAGESVYQDAKRMIAFSGEALQRARQKQAQGACTLRVGTSMLNPCKPFMDLWNQVSDRFSQYKIDVIPFEDDHANILSVIGQIGKTFDFLVGVCDSAQWMQRCSFYPLGVYRKCVAVPLDHRLARRKRLRVSDLHGETLFMVKRGDSSLNDRLRADLERDHPQIRIEDTEQFYDISVYNRCAQEGTLLLNVECWKDVHPGLVTLPVDWDYQIPYGILYAKDPPEAVRAFIRAVADARPHAQSSENKEGS